MKAYERVKQLEDLLKEAKDKHTIYEKSHGPDLHWERWYALFLHYRMEGINVDGAASWATIDNLNGSSL